MALHSYMISVLLRQWRSVVFSAAECRDAPLANMLAAMQFHDGPLAGIKGVQSTIGDYTVDDAEPSKQKVHSTSRDIQSGLSYIRFCWLSTALLNSESNACGISEIRSALLRLNFCCTSTALLDSHLHACGMSELGRASKYLGGMQKLHRPKHNDVM